VAQLRGGLFGCGMISEFHLRGWQRIPEVEVVALGNRTISRAEARRDQYVPGARVYADLAVMLREERLDFVDILSLPWLHRAHCLQAREAGVHVICQKPLCSSLEEARLLVREMAESPRLFRGPRESSLPPVVSEGPRAASRGILRHASLSSIGAVRFP